MVHTASSFDSTAAAVAAAANVVVPAASVQAVENVYHASTRWLAKPKNCWKELILIYEAIKQGDLQTVKRLITNELTTVDQK